jgi:hypothetical protein
MLFRSVGRARLLLLMRSGARRRHRGVHVGAGRLALRAGGLDASEHCVSGLRRGDFIWVARFSWVDFEND